MNFPKRIEFNIDGNEINCQILRNHGAVPLEVANVVKFIWNCRSGWQCILQFQVDPSREFDFQTSPVDYEEGALSVQIPFTRPLVSAAERLASSSRRHFDPAAFYNRLSTRCLISW